MSLGAFAQGYDALPAPEQAQLEDAIRRLLADGFVWRDDVASRRAYAMLLRHSELVSAYLRIAGWVLRHDEQISAFHVAHRDGLHRRRLDRNETIWLLLARLMAAEQHESPRVRQTLYPTVTVDELARRYLELFPGQVPRIKTSMEQGLHTLQTLKLIRAAEGGAIRMKHVDQVVELLPTLELIVPAGEIAALNERLRAFDRTAPHAGVEADAVTPSAAEQVDVGIAPDVGEAR